MNVQRKGPARITAQQEYEEAGRSGPLGYLLGYIIPGLVFFAICTAIVQIVEWFK